MDDAAMTDARNVVAMTKFRPDAEVDCFDALRTYWDALRAGRIMPDRHEVDPRGLAGILDRIFLIERIAPAQARFRVAGQHLAEVAGTELRGLPATCLFTPAARLRIEDTLKALFDEPAVVEIELSGPRSGLFGRVTGRLTLLPLRGPDGEVTRAIGCFSVRGNARGRAPQRFDIVEERRQTLIGYAAPAHQASDIAAFETADRAREAVRSHAADRPTLRLVTSN